MRVAIFTNTYLPTINGVVNSIEAFRKGLEQTGHEVYVFAPKPPAPYEDGEGVFRYPSRCLGRAPEYPLALPFSRPKGRASPDLAVDVVHTQHPWLVGQWGLAFARRRGLPAITTIHTQYEQYAHYAWPIPPAWLGAPLRRAVRQHCRRCTIVATPGRAMREYLAAIGVTRPVEVVPNATDLSGFDTAQGDEVRGRYGIGADERLYMFVGRAAREKSLDKLIEAFALVAEQLAGARLMIVGGGAALDSLRALAERQPCAPRIILTGAVPYGTIREYHAAADVFVTTSLTEVQPLSLSEAMAARTPVIGFDAGGINDMVQSGDSGLLVPTTEGLPGFARAMVELGTDGARRERMAEAAQRASRQYHIPIATEKLVAVYRRAIEVYAGG